MAELLVILFKGCGEDCTNIMNQINAASMKKFLKETYDIDKIRELDAETDDIASQIMVSTENYELPIIAVIKKGSPEQVCTFRLDPVQIESCVELKKVPKK
jgi:hypothetical protein